MFSDNNPIFEFRGPFGVPVEIGSSLLFLLVFYLYTGSGDIAWTALFVGMLLLSIFLHELGHAWACLVQGIPVRRIMLYGGGGFCERSRSASAYQQEFIVVMGPIVNIALWAVFSLISHAMMSGIFDDMTRSPNPAAVLETPKAKLAQTFAMFAYINGFLAIFNLIPVQPLDGGKLFHLGLLRLIKQETAMVVTGAVGLAISVLWIPGMLLAFGLGWWILFFVPSIPLHWAMVKKRLA